MQHSANLGNKDLICCGHKVCNHFMSAQDLDWARKHPSIQQDQDGRWYHTGITERDRQYRNNYWNPDTGPWRKGVNY